MQSNVQIQVAARIKELMKENNLNQVGLAAKTGIKQNTISAWLLADYFNVDIDYLVGRKDY